jgi:outer membrane protein insertion porin family
VSKLKPLKSPAGMFALSLLITMGQFSYCVPAFAEVGENHFQLPVEGKLSGSSTDSTSSDSSSGPGVFHVGTSEGSALGADSGGGSNTSNMLVDDVKIEGNRLISTEEIATVVKTRKGDRYNRDQVMSDLKAIDGMGYFNKNTLQVNPEVTPAGLLLKIRVEENAPITQFAITGNSAISTEEISKLFSDQLGRPSNLNALSNAISKVEAAYRERGFVLANVTDVKDDPDGSVELVINEGTIDNIVITGNKKTQDYVIRHAFKLKAGSVYNEKQLTNDLRKLYANGYFQDIRRSLVPSEKDPGKFTLKVEVDEKRSGSVQAGGGVDSLAGPFGSVGFSDNNFGGRGQVISASTQIGSGTVNGLTNNLNNGGSNFLPTGRTYNAELSFIEPSLYGSDTAMSVTAFGRDMASMAISQTMQQTVGLTTNFSKPLSHGWTGNLGLTGESTTLKDVANFYQNQSIITTMMDNAITTGMAPNFSQAAGIASQYRSQQLKGGVFASVSPSLSYDTRDARIDASTGTNIRLSTTPTLGLSTSFMKAGASYSKFMKLNEDTVLATNATFGTSLGTMPQFAQYRLGGMFGNGVRGFRSFTDLGTGSTMLMGTLELRRKLHLPGENVVSKVINKNVKWTAWCDYGQVLGNNNMNSLLGRTSYGASVGVGLRVKMPMIGMIRLDVGLPVLSTLNQQYVPRFNIGFGDKF